MTIAVRNGVPKAPSSTIDGVPTLTAVKPTEKKGKKGKEPVRLFTIDVREMKLMLRGDTPLVCNQFGHTAIDKIEDKHRGKMATPRAPKDPEALYHASYYLLPGTTQKKPKYGFPAIAFKRAVVDACKFTNKAIFATVARGALHVMENAGRYVEIIGKPQMRRDTVRNATGVCDLRYRAEFREWETTITVRYNANVLGPEHIVNLFTIAGFSIGVGEGRPERNGVNGCFSVVSIK